MRHRGRSCMRPVVTALPGGRRVPPPILWRAMKIRSGIALFLLGAAALGGCRGGGRGEVVIGIAGPLAKPTGRSMKLAAEMAVKEINAAGGIGGRTVRLVFGDDNADASKAIEVA